MVTELLNLKYGQSPVSVRPSIRQSVTMISAGDASSSENMLSSRICDEVKNIGNIEKLEVLIMSFTPFGRSGRVTHPTVQ